MLYMHMKALSFRVGKNRILFISFATLNEELSLIDQGTASDNLRLDVLI